MPYSIMVDAEGDRFANESESYVDLGHHMLEHDKDGTVLARSPTPATPAATCAATRWTRARTKAMKEAGSWSRRTPSRSSPRRSAIDPARLQATVERFNGFARSGVDGDFGRGNSAYDRYYGDPTVHPNPNLGPLEKGPFTAVKVVVGDLGTKGGVRHRRRRPRPARGRHRHRGPVRGRQQLGLGHGPHLPGPRVDHRTGRRVRPARRPPHGPRPQLSTPAPVAQDRRPCHLVGPDLTL